MQFSAPPGYGIGAPLRALGAGPGAPVAPFGAHVSPLTLEDVERAIRIYAFVIYWVDARGHKLSLQRSIIASTKTEVELGADLLLITRELSELSPSVYKQRRDYQFEILDVEDLARMGKMQPPYDSTIVALSAPLTIAKKSSSTGTVYHDPTMRYCPHTKGKLGFFVTTRPTS